MRNIYFEWQTGMKQAKCITVQWGSFVNIRGVLEMKFFPIIITSEIMKKILDIYPIVFCLIFIALQDLVLERIRFIELTGDLTKQGCTKISNSINSNLIILKYLLLLVPFCLIFLPNYIKQVVSNTTFFLRKMIVVLFNSCNKKELSFLLKKRPQK